MKIGVISDTHGRLHPRAIELLKDTDHILHAGDIGGEWILDELRRLAPVTAVAGNNDNWKCGSAGIEAEVTLEGLNFYLTHVLTNREIANSRIREIDVLVFGHSHLPHNEKLDGLWLFNPASAGPRRFDYPASIGFFEKRGAWRAWHEPLDERSKSALMQRMNQIDVRKLKTRNVSSSGRSAD